MFYKCALLAGGVAYDATDDLRNWEDVKSTIARKDYGGAVHTFTSAFTFVGEGRTRIVAEYEKNGLAAQLGVAFYTRTNSREWKEEFVKTLDVSTLSYTAWEASMNAVDDSVEAIIKAKKGTQYEYSVEAHKEDKPLRYDGIEMENSVTWDLSGETQDDGSVTFEIGGEVAGFVEHYYYFPLFIMGEDNTANRFVKYSDSGIGLAPDNKQNIQYIMQAEGGTVEVTPEYDMEIKVTYDHPNEYNYAFRAGLFIHRAGSDALEVWHLPTTLPHDTFMRIASGDFNGKTATLGAGDSLGMFFNWNDSGLFLADTATVTVKPGASFKVGWKSRRTPVMLPLIKPLELLNSLLRSMNGGKDGITGQINFLDTRGQTCRLLAAEAIRWMSGAKIYSSFQQFCDWMSAVFGMVYYVDGTTVKFVHRDMLFRTQVVKELAETTDFSYSVNKSLIWSQVNAGYEKQDYDSTNGRYEFNQTTYYETGVTLTENTLELISPYRADCYGIEFLADKRGEDTTDSDSDSDLFFVAVGAYSDYYVLLRDQSEQVEGAPAGVFNARYSPRSCVLANEAYIGVSAEHLTYTSSTGNSEASIGGVRQDSDVEIGKRLFTVGEIEVTTDDLKLPENWNGLVELEQGGRTYRGFLSEVDVTYTREESATYKLIAYELN